jgi:hypothetical protein
MIRVLIGSACFYPFLGTVSHMKMTSVSRVLDLSKAPDDPLEAIAWLDGVIEKARAELDDAYAAAYFKARLEGRFLDALRIGRLSRKRALALVRRHNERTGRSVRWNDGLDPSSTRYSG